MPITDPTDLADLAAWYDPDQIDIANTHFVGGIQYIDLWEDAAGLADDWDSQGASEPVLAPNVKLGNSMARFTGAQYMTLASALSLSVPYSFWIVLSAGPTNNGGIIVCEADGTPQWSLASNGQLTAYDGGVAHTSGGVVLGSQGAPVVMGVTVGATTRTVRINGAQVFTTGTGSPEAAFDLRYLARYGPSSSFFLEADIGEMVFCSDELAGTDLDDLEYYLYDRWVQPILDGDADGPFKAPAPLSFSALPLGPPTIGGPPWSSPAVLALTGSALGDDFDSAVIIGGVLILEGHMQIQIDVPWVTPPGAQVYQATRYEHEDDPTGWDGGPTYD